MPACGVPLKVPPLANSRLLGKLDAVANVVAPLPPVLVKVWLNA